MMDAIACETSDDCGALKCIDGRCRDPFAAQQEESKPLATLGHKAWFGSGEGYGAVVAAFDLGATAVEPLLMIATQSAQGEQQTILGIICFVPVTLAGSIVHWAHGRVGPGFISFFAWSSHVATTFGVGGLFGLAFGAAGAAALTWLDVWMARTVHEPTTTSLRFSPAIIPTQGGAIAALGGTF